MINTNKSIFRRCLFILMSNKNYHTMLIIQEVLRCITRVIETLTKSKRQISLT